jgi:hypothetical protein
MLDFVGLQFSRKLGRTVAVGLCKATGLLWGRAGCKKGFPYE